MSWRDAVLTNMEQNRGDSDSLRQTRSVLLRLRPEGQRLMARAALAMGVSQSTYMRRAIAVQISGHLSAPLEDVLAVQPAYNKHNHGLLSDRFEPDSGERITDYCPHPGCDGAHWAYIEKERDMSVQPTEVETTLDTTTDPIVTGPPEPSPPTEPADEQ